MDDRGQLFASNSIYFFHNLFGAYLNTPHSANDYMQYMHPNTLWQWSRKFFYYNANEYTTPTIWI